MRRHSPSILPTSPPLPTGVRRVYEQPRDSFAAVTLVEWEERFPWLVQGVTTRRAVSDSADFDLRLFPESEGARDRWSDLLAWSGFRAGVHARQVHEARVLRHEGVSEAGLTQAPACDGHFTETPGLLLTVSVADCVPVYVLDPSRRCVGMIHAGWRGAAAGILEEGVRGMIGSSGDVGALHVHLGPSICGACYEVGGEVFEALGLPRPPAPAPIDLRAMLALRAVGAGVAPKAVTVSGRCTLCGPERRFFSHRGGDGGRQVGFVGIRP